MLTYRLEFLSSHRLIDHFLAPDCRSTGIGSLIRDLLEDFLHHVYLTRIVDRLIVVEANTSYTIAFIVGCSVGVHWSFINLVLMMRCVFFHFLIVAIDVKVIYALRLA